MAAPAHNTPIGLPAGWGTAHVVDSLTATPAYRSYDNKGRCLEWNPASKSTFQAHACDFEYADEKIWMAEYFNVQPPEFLRKWVCVEVVAKLCKMPVFLWIKKHGLPDIEITPDAPQHLNINDHSLEFIYLFSPALNSHLAFGRLQKNFPANTRSKGLIRA